MSSELLWALPSLTAEPEKLPFLIVVIKTVNFLIGELGFLQPVKKQKTINLEMTIKCKNSKPDIQGFCSMGSS